MRPAPRSCHSAHRRRSICVFIPTPPPHDREMARLLERRHLEIDEAAAHEADAVAEVRARLQAHIDQLEAALTAAHAETTAATATAERALRDARSSQQESDRASATARQQMVALEATITELNARSRALQEERDAAERRVRARSLR